MKNIGILVCFMTVTVSYASERMPQEKLRYLKEVQKFHNSCCHLLLDFQDHEIKEVPNFEISGTLAEGISWLSAAITAWSVDYLAQSVGVNDLKGPVLAATSAVLVQRVLYNQLYLKRSPQGVLTTMDHFISKEQDAINKMQQQLDTLENGKVREKTLQDLKAYLIGINRIKIESSNYSDNRYIKQIHGRCEAIVLGASKYGISFEQ